MKAAVRNTALALALVAGGSACASKSEMAPQDKQIILGDLEKAGFTAERFTIDPDDMKEATRSYFVKEWRGFIGRIGVKGCKKEVDVTFRSVEGLYTPTTFPFDDNPNLSRSYNQADDKILTPESTISHFGCRAAWEDFAAQEAVEAQQ